MADLRYALRTLFKQPGFAAVVVITLALGIGASTAIFSVVNSVLLRPVPLRNSDRLQVIWGNFRALNIERLPARSSEYLEYSGQKEVFDSVAAYTHQNFNLSVGDEAERISGANISSNLFSMLETQPAIGRLYSSDEELEGRAVILSDAFWQRRFGGDRSIVNQTIMLDGDNYTVIGVMPAGFQFPHPSFSWAEPADLWLPLNPGNLFYAQNPGPYYLNVLARLAPGVTLEQARTHMNALAQRFER